MTIHGRQGTAPTPETPTILFTSRCLIGLAGDDSDRRAKIMQCLRAIKDLDESIFEARYEVAVLRRYYDLLGARLRAACPAYRKPTLGGGLSLDIYAAAADMALTFLPRRAVGW